MAVVLSEQVGAISIIDSLRHRQMAVQEHMDLPARKLEVAQRIREYYHGQSIQVDDDLINQGVAQYFSGRLAFELPPQKSLAQKLARAYVTRKKWLPYAAAGLIAASVGVVSIGAAATIYVDKQVEEVTSRVSLLADQRNQIDAEIIRQNDDVRNIAKQIAQNSLPSAARMLPFVVEQVQAASVLVKDVDLPAKTTYSSRKGDMQAIDSQAGKINEAAEKLVQSRGQLDHVAQLLQVRNNYSGVVEGRAFKKFAPNYPALKVAAASVAAAIDTADTTGVPEADAANSKLLNLTGAVEAIDPLRSQYREIAAQFKVIPLSAADKERVESLSKTAQDAFETLDRHSAQEALNAFAGSLAYAKAPLTLNIVSRAGIKSGVERTYGATGGKSWYVVVEATDANGTAVPVPIKSSESGKTKKAMIFGVRVSQEEYNKVRDDKKADGHVDNRAMGTKPVNSLSLQFNDRALPSADVILEW